MVLMLISPNPLFEELIIDLIAKCEGIRVISADPCTAREMIAKSKPKVIVVDETLERELKAGIFSEARSLKNARIVLVDPRSNDYVILDSQRSTMKKTEDLIQAIQGLDIARN